MQTGIRLSDEGVVWWGCWLAGWSPGFYLWRGRGTQEKLSARITWIRIVTACELRNKKRHWQSLKYFPVFYENNFFYGTVRHSSVTGLSEKWVS